MVIEAFRRIALLKSLVILSVLLLAACQVTRSASVEGKVVDTIPNLPEASKYEEFVVSGQLLPIKSIVDVNDEIVDLAVQDKRKLLVLFSTWCPDSNRALKALNQSALLNDDSIQIIAIAREETAETVKAWRDKYDIRVPLAADPDRSIFSQFAAAGIPRFITVSSYNKVIKMNLAEGENPLTLIEW